MNVVLKKSNRKDKKFMVDIKGKQVHFGERGASDMTKHHDEDRKKRYLRRRSDKEKKVWNNIERPSFWAKNLLWNKPSLRESIKDIEAKNKGIKIVRKK